MSSATSFASRLASSPILHVAGTLRKVRANPKRATDDGIVGRVERCTSTIEVNSIEVNSLEGRTLRWKTTWKHGPHPCVLHATPCEGDAMRTKVTWDARSMRWKPADGWRGVMRSRRWKGRERFRTSTRFESSEWSERTKEGDTIQRLSSTDSACSHTQESTSCFELLHVCVVVCVWEVHFHTCLRSIDVSKPRHARLSRCGISHRPYLFK